MSGENGQEMVELKHMVMSFRVSELQVLLGSAGRNKSGRKHDLLSRALQLLKNGCNSQIQERIRELYLRRFPRSKAIQSPSFNMPKEKRVDYDSKDKKRLQGLDYPNMNHRPIHPNVTFKGLPFYDVLSDVLKPSSLITRPNRERSRGIFTFTLSEEQVQIINESKIKDQMKKRYQVQVQLRFCLLETTCEQKDFLPPDLFVQVNRQNVQLPQYIPPAKAGVEPRRANRPIDITMCCRLNDIAHNRMEVTYVSDHGKNYAICVNVVRPLSSETLLQRLRRKGIKNSGHSSALIKEKLTRDPESEIATTSLKVSLLCPLGKMRMTTPTRPLTCTHMQCFDAMLFLQMNEKKPTWTCPVCDKPAEFSNLFIDGLFMEILNETASQEVVFLEDGKWQPVKSNKECLSLCTPSKSSNTIALDLSNSPNVSPAVNGDSKRKETDVIDLTADSSDDEKVPSPPKRKDIDKEQDEIHSLSSTSPYRSDTASVHREEGRPPFKRRTPQDLSWDSIREVPHSAPMPANIFNAANPSPRPGSYGQTDLPERGVHPILSHTPNFSLPSSRDNTPPSHPFGHLFNPNIPPFASHLDYTNAASLDFQYLLNHNYDPLRRLPGDHSARSSPFLMSAPNHMYPPSTHSYPPHYHPYSPISFLQSQDASDVIPID